LNWRLALRHGYFDHNATTPVPAEVRVALQAAVCEVFGNPSSVHQEGQHARRRIETARAQVASLLNCRPKEIVWTSGGTEAANLALLGAVRARRREDTHVITTAIEHPAVLNVAAALKQEGVAVTYVRPSANGTVEPEAIWREIRPETVLVSVMHANNETGVVQPIGRIARIVREQGILMHSDGVQAAGKIPVDVNELNVDLYSISGHKFGAPKGCGALFVRPGVGLKPLQYGGRHEQGRRAGTENVPGAIAMGVAASLPRDFEAISVLRDRLEEGILARVPGVFVNGGSAARVSNTSNICFPGIEGEAVVIALDLQGFAVSSGSACSSGAVEPSHVLLAMGLPREDARSSVRFSLGPANTAEQVDLLIDAVEQAAAHLRRLSPAFAHAAG
jgi:cysteine desulfurase